MTLVSLANDVGSGTEFILRGRSFKYIMNNIGLELILGELLVPVYSSRRKNFELY